jgi:hypothetical protein
MDILHDKLNDDVMSIIYRKIHESKFRNCLIKFKYFLKKYYCCRYKCEYRGNAVSFYEGRYMCYSCAGLNKSYQHLDDLNYRGAGAIKRIYFYDNPF